MKKQRQIFSAIGVVLTFCGLLPIPVQAQNTVLFSTSDAGQTKSVGEWGIDTSWPSFDNVRQSVAHMGVNNVDVVRLTFHPAYPLTDNGDGTYSLSATAKGYINDQLSLAAMAGSKPLTLMPGEFGPPFDATHWLRTIKATQEYINSRPGFTTTQIKSIEVFNEPDFWAGEGSSADLNNIITQLKSYPVFQNTAFPAGSTLSSNNAWAWYDPVPAATAGSSHLLGGSMSNWVNFIEHVKSTGKPFVNLELHSLGEAIAGAEHGMTSGIFWADALRARGLFVQASEGKRLGYREDLARQSAAAVYRAPDGKMYAFAGGLERFGDATAYRFVSTDKDVYFNGIPVREYMLQTKLDETNAVNPPGSDFDNYGSWSNQGAYADIETTPGLSALDGYRWKIVNSANGQVMEVVGSGTGDGALIRFASDANGLNQKWNIVRTRNGYYHLFNANSGRTAEVADGSLNNGASVRQWGTADNQFQQWYIDEAGSGSFYIRNAYSNKYMTGSASNNFQNDNTTILNNFQKWRFVLANPNLPATAQYGFEGNVNSSIGTQHGVASGNPMYGTGPSGQGQAINLDGADDYVTLPSGVANNSNITISTYVKWDGGNAWQRIFDFGNSTSSYMFLTPRSGDNTMRFAITTGTGEQILDTAPLPIGQWVHLTLTLGGNTGVLFVDGKPRVAGQILLNPDHVSPALNYIGKSQFNDPLFDGAIDDFRIYDYALDPGQVAGLVFHRWTGELDSNWTTTTQASPKNWQYNIAAEDYVNGNGVLFDDYAFNFTVNLPGGTVSPGSIEFDNTRFNYVLNGPGAVAGSGVLTKNGGGALTINNANTYSGGTVLGEGTLNLNNASALGTGALTIAGGTTINNTSGSAINLSTNNAQLWNGDFTFGGSSPLNMGSGAVTLTGNRTVNVNGAGALTVGPIGESGGSRQLIKAGPGTLVLTGNNTYTGSTYVTGGTLTVGGTLNSSSADVSVGQGAGGSGNFNVPSGGTVTANVVLIGVGGSPGALANGTGTLASGGTINTRQWFVIAHSGAAGTSGSFTVNGGTLNVHTNAAAVGNLEMGTFDATSATLDINTGSNVKLLNNALLVFGAQFNHTGTSIINHNGGNVTFYSDGGTTVGGNGRLVMASAANPTGNYTYNLNGGTLAVPRIGRENTANNPTTVFNFNGGTLKPTANQAAFLSGLTRANIRDGGAIIDTNGFAVTIAQPLLHSNIVGDNAADGGLTKNGAGTLTLSDAATYSGPTVVNAGTLKITQSSRASSGLAVASGARLEMTPRSGGVKTLQVGTLNLNTSGTLDLADNDLVVDNGVFDSIFATVVAGFGTSGPGIISSITDGSQILALFDNALIGAPDWNGAAIGANAVVGKYTYFGDLNIDGQVTGDDYTVIDANFGTSPAVGIQWLSGDANLDGAITGDDYTVIDANLGLGNGNPLSASMLMSIPEPSLGAPTLVALLLACRRRNFSRLLSN